MLKIGHRGAAGHRFENSIESINKAIELKVDFIELDIQLTKDSVPVIFHDLLLDRLTNKTGFLKNYTLNELSKEVYLNNGERIPTLIKILELTSKFDVGLYLEIKSEGSEQIIIDCLSSIQNTNKILLGSFFHSVIKKIKDISSFYQTIAIFEGSPLSLDNIIIETKCDYVSVGYESTNFEMINRLKEFNKKIFVWTVDNPKVIEMVTKWGIDGIVSNFPERIKPV